MSNNGNAATAYTVSVEGWELDRCLEIGLGFNLLQGRERSVLRARRCGTIERAVSYLSAFVVGSN
jgi:hypothetical protein